MRRRPLTAAAGHASFLPYRMHRPVAPRCSRPVHALHQSPRQIFQLLRVLSTVADDWLVVPIPGPVMYA